MAKRIGLLMGGRSGEHDVSLVTGREVAAALHGRGHETLALTLEREGGARWGSSGQGSVLESLTALHAWRPDAAFIAMHGPFGEDGRIQAALELIGVPYQGSGVLASATCLDKARTKDLYRLAGLPVARDLVLRGAPNWDAVAAELGLPLVLKTRQSGSSVGVEVAQSQAELRAHGADLLATSDYVLAEEWLPGVEYTTAVLEQAPGAPQALPIVEIRPVSALYFDYEAKYTPGATEEICPAPIEASLADELARLGVRAHELLGCRGYSRTDFKLDAEGRPRLLETNTLPGLTPASLFPKAAAAAGMTFPDLVERLIGLALS